VSVPCQSSRTPVPANRLMESQYQVSQFPLRTNVGAIFAKLDKQFLATGKKVCQCLMRRLFFKALSQSTAAAQERPRSGCPAHGQRLTASEAGTSSRPGELVP